MSTGVYTDSSGKALTDYPRPSLAVDTAVLTVPDDERRLGVLLVRRDGAGDRVAWALPGTFLHEGETLGAAVGRALRDKVGLPDDVVPQQLHVFDRPDRDDRGWVLSVAHVVALPWQVVEPVLRARPDELDVQPVDAAQDLLFDHDDIVRRAVEWLRARYAERPDPAGLLEEPFTMRQLRQLHTAVAGEPPSSSDTFRRLMKVHLMGEEGAVLRGTVGKPAQLFRRS
jgi:ADP-ribose pyrophosphatase YjhB (NUDIX family)